MLQPEKHVHFDRCRGVVFSVLFQPRQMTVISGADDAEVRLWDLVDKSCITVLKVPFPLPLPFAVPRSAASFCSLPQTFFAESHKWSAA